MNIILLEPWIQWVTAHTGLTFEQHNVFRLGDIADKDIPQIWEYLETNGISVGAVSPMNANNRVSKAVFLFLIRGLIHRKREMSLCVA